ncbi:hypothetical protein [Bradyrhizobium sp.]|uniref:hypothetical protein n=1 Tax=Bradyrhizobium sp. TaxID=376 RepID=UPI0025BCB4A4|nr:hypothetical protein [Bradyrhizobium sp.]
MIVHPRAGVFQRSVPPRASAAHRSATSIDTLDRKTIDDTAVSLQPLVRAGGAGAAH